MDNEQQILSFLERIAIATEAALRPTAREGFFAYSKTVFANVTKGNGDGWYTVQDGITVTELPIFRGQVLNINFPTVERRGQDVRKFHLVMQANGKTVTFESGHNCFFSKTMLSALALVSPEVLAQPIQLATFVKKLDTGDKTLAASIRDCDGNKLSCDWTNDDDWKSIAALAIANVEAAAALR